MTDAPATVTTIEHGEASAMPEVNWLWRRVFVFALSICFCGLVWWIATRSSDIPTLREIARNSQWIILFCVFAYVMGASATDAVRLATALRSTRKETVTTAPAGAAAAPDIVASAVAAAKAALQDLPPWKR